MENSLRPMARTLSQLPSGGPVAPKVPQQWIHVRLKPGIVGHYTINTAKGQFTFEAVKKQSYSIPATDWTDDEGAMFGKFKAFGDIFDIEVSNEPLLGIRGSEPEQEEMADDEVADESDAPGTVAAPEAEQQQEAAAEQEKPKAPSLTQRLTARARAAFTTSTQDEGEEVEDSGQADPDPEAMAAEEGKGAGASVADPGTDPTKVSDAERAVVVPRQRIRVGPRG